ncbi:MAG: hypothetical protein MPW14_22605 [Candidatus Manganitrophus sp.]|nr:MAG: hypothetical protein MPW14_22605 [Candidatus Manganitrophus sp.]
MSIRSVVASVRDCLFVIALFAGSAAYAADFTPLGAVPDSTSLGSAANAVSADGRTIAGTSDVYGGSYVVQWRNDIGPLNLRIVSSSTRVTAMSATGEEIIGNLGWSTTGSFYWSSLTGPIFPMVLPGYSNSTANAISADGSMMVGAVYNSGYPNSNWGAVRWSRTYISSFSSYNYFVGLGYLPGGATPSATPMRCRGTAPLSLVRVRVRMQSGRHSDGPRQPAWSGSGSFREEREARRILFRGTGE